VCLFGISLFIEGVLMQNSWYVKGDGVHHFFCQCGSHDTLKDMPQDEEFEILEFNRDEIDFHKIPNLYYPDNSCSSCGNECYLDRDALLFQDKTRYWSEIVFEYEEQVHTLGWSVWAMLRIPEYDKELKEFYFKNIRLLENHFEYNGKENIYSEMNYFLKKEMKLKDKYVQLNRYLKEKLDNKMLLLMLRRPTKEIAWLCDELSDKRPFTITKDILSFFMKHKYLQFIDIYFWKHRELFLIQKKEEQGVMFTLSYVLNYRTEKSLCKAHYNSYMEQMENGGYNPLVEYIFSRTINDTNHLLKILVLPFDVKQKFFQENSIESIYYFIDFLKHFYAEKQIVQLWLNISDGWLNSFYLKDTINLFHEQKIRETLPLMFRKTSLNIKVMHNQLIQHYKVITKSMIDSNEISYSENILSCELSYEGLEYRVAKSKAELYEWGMKLHNCLFSYHYNIVIGKSVVFGIFIDKKLHYAMEIRGERMVQLSGVCNSGVDSDYKQKISLWFNDVYIKNYIKIFN
jgi:hypothetical protein